MGFLDQVDCVPCFPAFHADPLFLEGVDLLPDMGDQVVTRRVRIWWGTTQGAIGFLGNQQPFLLQEFGICIIQGRTKDDQPMTWRCCQEKKYSCIDRPIITGHLICYYVR